MLRRRPTAARPAGFTLIELLIAITIIAILSALTVVGVRVAIGAAKKAKTGAEVNDLAAACTAFKTKFGSYPPAGSFTVPVNVDSNDVNYQKLKRLFPRWTPMKPNPSGVPTDPPVPAVQGDALSSTIDGSLTYAGLTLDANQCLLHFLAGPGGTGWHPAKPYAPSGTTAVGPFYDFKPAQKIDTSGQASIYVDPYNTPYMYLPSALGTNVTLNGGQSVTAFATTFNNTQKPLITGGIYIISAGPDTMFGSGSPVSNPGPPVVYTPYTPGQGDYADGARGYDDVANFNSGAPLGVSP